MKAINNIMELFQEKGEDEEVGIDEALDAYYDAFEE